VEEAKNEIDPLRDEIDKELQTKIVKLQKEMKKMQLVDRTKTQELTQELVMKMSTRTVSAALQDLRDIRDEFDQ
jgi:hypothetical protein